MSHGESPIFTAQKILKSFPEEAIGHGTNILSTETTNLTASQSRKNTLSQGNSVSLIMRYLDEIIHHKLVKTISHALVQSDLSSKPEALYMQCL